MSSRVCVTPLKSGLVDSAGFSTFGRAFAVRGAFPSRELSAARDASVASGCAALASAARSSSISVSPPVRSTLSGEDAAWARMRGEAVASRSCTAISFAEKVRTPRASTCATSGSLPPIRPVPRTHPMWACTSEVRAPQLDCSEDQRLTKASRAALASPYAPSPPKRPRLGEPGRTTCSR